MLMGRGSVRGFPPKPRRCSLSIQSIAMSAPIQLPIQRVARWFPQGIKRLGLEADNSYTYMRVSQMKPLNMFYLVIYWTPKVHNDLIFLCSIVLPPVGHSSNHGYHCWNLQDNRAVVRIFYRTFKVFIGLSLVIQKLGMNGTVLPLPQIPS